MSLAKAIILAASDCVFVDDQLKNVEGALVCGIPTVHFDVADPGKSYAKAVAMLGVNDKEATHA